MRPTITRLGFGLALVLAASPAFARNSSTPQSRDIRPVEDFRGSHRFSLDQDPSHFPAAAPGDTYILATYSFDAGASCVTEGWISVDHTAQIADFYHVAQATGGTANELDGGDFGRLVPVRGNKSLWCGAYNDYPTYPPDVMCGYQAMPGYGNGWNQAWCTKQCLSVTPGASITFIASWDSEPYYDGMYIEVDQCDDVWRWAGPAPWLGGRFDGVAVDSLHTHLIPDSLHSGSLRIRLHFTSDGAWSDSDGLWDTDGGILIDSLSVSDATGIVLAVEDFEDDPEGATSVQDWEACTPPGYGDYAGLIHGYEVVQEDLCRSDLSCMWNFFTGSTANYACGGFPGQPAMPFGNEEDQYLRQTIRSPLIPWTGAGASAELEFTVYRDLPLDNLQFYAWEIYQKSESGCLWSWNDLLFVYYGGQKDWFTTVAPFGVPSGTTDIQVWLHVMDMCGVWCGIYGTASCHSHAPLFDDVTVRRIEVDGPQWRDRDIDLFQDTFAEDGTVNATATGRADMANDINPSAVPAINPGDSAVVRVNDPDYGLAADAYTGFGTAVYAYVAVWPRNQPGKSGAALTQDGFRWPVVDSLQHTAGSWPGRYDWWPTTNTWYCIRTDTSFTNGAARTGAQPDAWCVDLNDNLFTVGDTIGFFFGAKNANGVWRYWTPFTGSTTSMTDALDNPDEFQILPGNAGGDGLDVLYVDGFDGRGAQPYFDQAFLYTWGNRSPDRYDIRGPSSFAGNHPGARVKNVFQQIIVPYNVIIWNTGDLSRGLIGTGDGDPEKSNDAYLLFTFLDQNPEPGGVFFSGDDLAFDMFNLHGASIDMSNLRNYIQGGVYTGGMSAVEAGFGTAPLVVGEPGSAFDHLFGPDEIVAYGGCPLINDFDVITPNGAALLAMNYGGAPSQTRGAIISQRTVNSAGAEVGVMLAGFSFHYIRDAHPSWPGARAHTMRDIVAWMGQALPIVDDADSPPARNSLSQNYPNPFNPTTTIRFTVRERTPVRLSIYNVAGQLVRTLVDDTRAKDVVHTVEWDGRNNAGQAVSSGVYFYRLVTKEFTQTRKMVLLK